MLIATLLAPLALAPVRADAVKVDAFFNDWEGRPVLALTEAVRGRVDDAVDLGARVQIAWSETALLVAAQVVDDRFVYGDGASGDGLAFVWGSPPHRLEIVLRDLEDVPPIARVDGQAVPGARLYGTYRKDGWAVEASVRWGRCRAWWGSRCFAAVVQDVDEKRRRGGAGEQPAGRAQGPTVVSLELSGGAGLEARFEAEQDHAEPLKRLAGNLYGGAGLPEQVRISDREIVVLGHELPDGVGYTFVTHGWRAGVTLVSAELRELDGRLGDDCTSCTASGRCQARPKWKWPKSGCFRWVAALRLRPEDAGAHPLDGRRGGHRPCFRGQEAAPAHRGAAGEGDRVQPRQLPVRRSPRHAVQPAADALGEQEGRGVHLQGGRLAVRPAGIRAAARR
ncbi:MAG: hypothetical protein R3F43_13645 [bacterium]